VRIAGIIKPARSKIKAGAKKITSAIGRAFLPLARPAIANKTLSTIKKRATEVKTEVNLVIVVERNSDIRLFTFLSLCAGSEY
jgi:hypothetical protein